MTAIFRQSFIEMKRATRADSESERCRVLRSITAPSAAAFAQMIGISPQRWNNIETGFPLSKDVAFRLVQWIPGLTLDWLYFGVTNGMSVDLLRRLVEAGWKGTTFPSSGKTGRGPAP